VDDPGGYRPLSVFFDAISSLEPAPAWLENAIARLIFCA
jgi:hypothetical protein